MDMMSKFSANDEIIDEYRYGLHDHHDHDPSHWYFSFGRHLDELHVTLAHLEKKLTRLRTYTHSTKKYYSQNVETVSQA
ncbi:hypothetical protein Tco_1288048 [Tanacetum coccineum]